MLKLVPFIFIPLLVLGCEQSEQKTVKPPPVQTKTDGGSKTEENTKTSFLDTEEVNIQDRIDFFTITPPEVDNVISFGNFQSPKPLSWTWTPPQSHNITCNYLAPSIDDNGSAMFSITLFDKGEGGEFASNVARWKSLFKSNNGAPVKPIAKVLKTNGKDIVIVEIQGEYMGAAASWHLQNHMLVVAEVKHEEGKTLFKLLGPKSAVQAHLPHFENVLRSTERIPSAE